MKGSTEKGGLRPHKDGVPQYMGLSGDRLIFAITLTSTMGFALFGYDQGIVSTLFQCNIGRDIDCRRSN